MHREILEILTRGEGDIIDITSDVSRIVRDSGIKNGLANIFLTGSTGAVTTIEYEDGVLSDLKRALSVIAPDNIPYAHDRRWGDGNGRSHVKASIVGPSLTVPIMDGSPACGTWQQIILLELDIRASRTRRIIITVTE